MARLFVIALFTITYFALAPFALTPLALAQTESPAPTTTLAPPTPPATAPQADNRPRKTAWTAHLLRRTPENLRLKTLEFPETKINVLIIARNDSLRPLVEVNGVYNRPGWVLFAQNVPVSQAATGSQFKFYAFLTARINEVVLTSRGPNGELEEERIYLFAPEAQEFQLVSPWNAVTLAAGVSSIDYFQERFGNYLAYTGTLSARYSTFDGPRQLGLYAGLDLTTVTLASQPVDRGPQFLDLRIDGTVTMPFNPQYSFKVQGLFGLNYLTMFANGSPFGFSDLLAPELGFRGRYILTATEAMIADLRYSFLGNLNADNPFADGGLLFAFTWSRTLLNSHRLDFGVNYSFQSYHPEPATRIQFSVLTFSVGYSI